MSNESVYSNKLHPGSAFPSISAALLNGEKTVLGQPQHGASWQLVVVCVCPALGCGRGS